MKKMSKGMLMAALICGAVYLVGTTPVYANELQEFALDEYVVTAARTETKLVDTPANISVVDAQTIEERHYQDVSEVLKDVPGANVVDKGSGTNEKVIRINGDDRVLVLIDGRRANIDMGSTSGGRNNIDLNQLPDVELIERIEVLKGAGGALYGSEAVGGVINIITKKADRNYGKVSYGFGSNGTEDYNVLYSLKEKNTGITFSASEYKQDYFKYKNIGDGTTKRWPGESKYENEKISLNISQDINTDSSIAVGFDYSKLEGMSNWKVTENGTPYDKTSKSFYSKYNWKLFNIGDGYFQYYHNELDYNNFGNMQEKTNAIDVQQSIHISESNKVVVGTSWRESDVKNSGDGNYNESVDNVAVFVSDSWEITPSWTFNAGVRYDHHSKSGNETTFSTGLNKKLNQDSHIYINWSEVFRAPSTDDLFYGGNMAGMYWFNGNPNLKPETGDTWTIGYSGKINDYTYARINYFESNLEDAIYWDYYDKMTVFNLHKQEKKGMELSVEHKFNNNLSLTASYTYLNMKNDKADGKGMLRDYNAIPNTYRLGVRYNNGKLIGNLWLRAGTGAETVSRTNYIESDYLTIDMTLRYEANKNLSIYAKGYNLFNEGYAEMAGTDGVSYDYPAQSRRFIVGAEYKF